MGDISISTCTMQSSASECPILNSQDAADTPDSKPRGSAVRRCCSADFGLDWFEFPDKTTWSLPAAWGVKALISRRKTAFQTPAFVTLQTGDMWENESFYVPVGFVLDDVPVGRIEKPKRLDMWSSQHGWFVDPTRFMSVLNAMLDGTPLPPIRVSCEQDAPMTVVNGFHRYFASLVLNYRDIPVLRKATHSPKEEKSRGRSKCRTRHTSICEAPATIKENLFASEETELAPAASRKARERSCAKASRTIPLRRAYEPPARRREREEQERKAKFKQNLERSILEQTYDKTVRNRAQADQTAKRVLSMRQPANPSVSWARVTSRQERAMARQFEVDTELAKFLSQMRPCMAQSRQSHLGDVGKT